MTCPSSPVDRCHCLVFFMRRICRFEMETRRITYWKSWLVSAAVLTWQRTKWKDRYNGRIIMVVHILRSADYVQMRACINAAFPWDIC